MIRFIKELLDAFLDLLFPEGLYCFVCGNFIDDKRPYRLCDHCREHFHWHIDEPVIMDGVPCISCCQYGLYERRLIFRLKYNRRKSTARIIGEIIADRLSVSNLDFQCIVPVPMEKSKERKRGFNHAYLIAKSVGEIIGKPVYKEALIRAKKTAPMRGLGPYERRTNISGAFDLGKEAGKIRGKKVLLLDDISTTFATGEECIKILRQANVENISFISFAGKNF